MQVRKEESVGENGTGEDLVDLLATGSRRKEECSATVESLPQPRGTFEILPGFLF